MDRRRSLLVASLVASMAMAASPTRAEAASLVDVATMRLRTSYVLKARLDFATGRIAASESISVTNRSGKRISKLNLSVMPRAFGELTHLGRVTVNGIAVRAGWTNNANLEVQLGRNVADGEKVTVRLSFGVRATSAIGTSLEGRLSKANGIMQVSQWFPIVSNGHPMRYPGDSQHTHAAAKIRLDLTTDASSVRIAAPGRRIESSGRRHVYELTNARDFAFGASPDYRVVSGTTGGVRVEAHYTTGAGASALASARVALARFESVFGEYQWDRYVVAQTGRKSSGNEYPGIVFLGGPLFSIREVVAHETAHQWWYAMVGNDQIAEPWLDEGLAEFSAAYFYGDLAGYRSSRPVNSPATAFPNVPAPLTSDDPDSYDQTVYFKAARFLDGLRVRMGSDRFFPGLRALVKANRNGVLTTVEFVETMRAYGASSSYLGAFLDL